MSNIIIIVCLLLIWRQCTVDNVLLFLSFSAWKEVKRRRHWGATSVAFVELVSNCCGNWLYMYVQISQSLLLKSQPTHKQPKSLLQKKIQLLLKQNQVPKKLLSFLESPKKLVSSRHSITMTMTKWACPMWIVAVRGVRMKKPVTAQETISTHCYRWKWGKFPFYSRYEQGRIKRERASVASKK